MIRIIIMVKKMIKTTAIIIKIVNKNYNNDNGNNDNNN